MDSSGPLLCILFVLLFLGGGYFAAAEIAFASVNKIRLRTRADDGDQRARKAMYVLANFDKALTTLLIGNNIMHLSTASLATVIATNLWGPSSVTYTTFAVTLLVFFFAEMIPKNYAKTNNEQFALSVAGSLCFLMKLLTPVSFLFGRLGTWLSRITHADETPTVTQDELDEIIENIDEEGTLDQQQSELIQNALDFDETTAQDVLTARVDMVCIDVHAKPEEILNIIKSEQFSRMPVYEENTDNIIGILHIRKYLRQYAKNGGKVDLRALLDEPCFVHKATNIDELLSFMSAKKIHLAIVTDEYGGTLGLITIEDIVEELVGEIWDESDEITWACRSAGAGVFEATGDCACMDLFDAMGFDDYDKDDFRHKNVGAWALEHFDRMPQKGEGFGAFDGAMRVKIDQLDHARIKKLTIRYHQELKQSNGQ